MKKVIVTPLITGIVLRAAGCEKVRPDYRPTTREQHPPSQEVFELQTRASVVESRVLNACHFRQADKELNSLGRQFLDRLMPDLLTHGGTVYVSEQGKPGLVRQRIAFVRGYLKDQGLPQAKFKVLPGISQAKGIIGEEAIIDYKESRKDRGGDSKDGGGTSVSF